MRLESRSFQMSPREESEKIKALREIHREELAVFCQKIDSL